MKSKALFPVRIASILLAAFLLAAYVLRSQVQQSRSVTPGSKSMALDPLKKPNATMLAPGSKSGRVFDLESPAAPVISNPPAKKTQKTWLKPLPESSKTSSTNTSLLAEHAL